MESINSKEVVSGKVKAITGFSAFSILIIATVWNFEAAAVNPALAVIIAAFPGETLSKLTFISTIPFITSITFSVIAGRLAMKYDKKKIAVIGLVLYGVTGILPAFLTDVNLILLFRLLTGIGVGLCMPIPAMLIAEYYVGFRREKMMGYMNTVFNISNGVISVVVGLLLIYGWQSAFYSFAFMFVVMIIVIIGCPKSPPDPSILKAKAREEKVPIPGYAYKMFVCMIFVWICFSSILLSAATFNEARAIVPMTIIGIMCAIPGTLNGIAALIYPYAAKFRYVYIAVSLFIAAVGFICVAYSYGVTLYVLGYVLMGFGTGLLTPYIITSTANNVPVVAREKSLGLVQAGIHTGALIATFIVTGLIGVGAAYGDPYVFTYMFYTYMLAIAGVAFVIVAIVSATRSKAGKAA
jgi:MFS family permease